MWLYCFNRKIAFVLLNFWKSVQTNQVFYALLLKYKIVGALSVQITWCLSFINKPTLCNSHQAEHLDICVQILTFKQKIGNRSICAVWSINHMLTGAILKWKSKLWKSSEFRLCPPDCPPPSGRLASGKMDEFLEKKVLTVFNRDSAPPQCFVSSRKLANFPDARRPL